VIPASARKELGIEVGARLLVFETFHGRGLALLKADAVEQILSLMSQRMAEVERLLKESSPGQEEEEL
jgi:bifunctional DNA-binding transcriptional regulator/antitoxin component of YhaV-PrlF toxin-antitoxin module